MNTQIPLKNMDYEDREDRENRFGRAIAMRLSDTTNHLPNDIVERLKAARVQAVAKRKVARFQLVSGVNVTNGSASLHGNDPDGTLWNRFAALLSLLTLIVGLLTIASFQDQKWLDDVAAVDVELLADDLPPDAYTDPGFLHFLRVNPRD